MSRPLRAHLATLFLLLACATLSPRDAAAQLALDSTTGKLPPDGPARSYILGDNLATLRANWASPANAHQAAWKPAIIGKANQAPPGIAPGNSPDSEPPAKFADCAVASSIAKAAAFRWAMDPAAPTASTDRAKALAALKVAAVPGGSEITRNEPATSYLLAYDFLRVEPIPAADDKLIRARLHAIAEKLGGGDSDSNVRGKVGSTRALAGLLLRDQSLLDRGLAELKNHFAYSTTDDGWYTDSQGHYLNYVLPHLAPFVRAYQQASGVDLYPNVQPLVDMTLGLRLPDGRVPCVSNGTNMFVATHLFAPSTDPATAAAVRWQLLSIPTNAFDLANTMNNDWTPTTFFALTPFPVTNPADKAAPTTAPATTPLPRSPTYHSPGQAGVSVFRNDWSAASDYLAMAAGVDSPPQDRPLLHTLGTKSGLFPAFHSQNDTGALFLASHGVLLLTSPGYDRRDLSNCPKDFDPKRADWHNVILVDGNLGTLPGPAGTYAHEENGIDYGGPHAGRVVRPGAFKHTHRLDSSEFSAGPDAQDGAQPGKSKGVCDVATLFMTCNDVAVRRTIAFPHEDYFVVADDASPARLDDLDKRKPHRYAVTRSYAFNLVGRGKQTVLTQTPDLIQVKWEADGQQVIAHLVSSEPMTLSTASLWLHDHYNAFEPTKRMQAEVKAVAAGFVCVFETGKAGAPPRLEAKQQNKASGEDLFVTVANKAAGWVDMLQSAAPKWRDPKDPFAHLGVHQDLTFSRLVGINEQSLMCTAVDNELPTIHDIRTPPPGTTNPDRALAVAADHPLTISLMRDEKEVRGTISPDGFVPGTKLTIRGRTGSTSATVDGQPAPVVDEDITCVVTLPRPGPLVVKFKR
ncbi:MAG: hypothetical protein NTW19_00925 [Planctomycetota bacterium]|nr:hypothetical protein [Planctomycetota bacterium]